jgi:ABC-type spermidine/putrescine transport system permease subunit II
VALIVCSLSQFAGLSFPFAGLSLRWYVEFFSNGQVLEAVKNSAIVALGTAVTTGILGSMAALAFPRLSPGAKAILSWTTFAPIALPGLFVGISLLAFLALAKVQLTLATVTIAHVVVTLPFFVVAARSRVELFDLTLEEAARDLGATPLQTFRLVTLPIIAPTLIGATIMSFALSFDEFVVTSFVIGTESTLPMLIWSMMRRTVTPLINAVSTLALALSVLLLALAGLFFWIQQRRSRHARLSSRRCLSRDRRSSSPPPDQQSFGGAAVDTISSTCSTANS